LYNPTVARHRGESADRVANDLPAASVSGLGGSRGDELGVLVTGYA